MSSLLVIAAASYLAGSLPTGVWLARLRSRPDPRSVGSGNTGAANVLRTQGRGAALLVALVDLAKGAFAVAVLARISWPEAAGPDVAAAVAGVAAIVGHVRPVLAGFRGGKGVATAAGATLAISPLTVAVGFIVFLGTLIQVRRVSVASLTAVVCLPLAFYLVGVVENRPAPAATLLFGGVTAILVLATHRPNIRRLFEGSEPRIGEWPDDR